jgi:outer membrane receptor protein involved in Fe transport
VPEAGVADDRTAASPFYRFDHADDQRHRASVRLDEALGSDRVLSVDIGVELRDLDRTRTLPLTPEFADTKERHLSSLRTQGELQLTAPALWLENDQLVVGADGSVGTADTEYFGVLTGDADAYSGASGERGDLDARGHARRSMLSGFLQYNLRPTDRIKLSVGGRYDRVSDRYRAEEPDPGDETSTTHEAFSPKAGINIELFGSGSSATHWFANVARAFKAPTLDQLYDRRSTPVPFPPFSITTSNQDLVPQEGTSFEAGFYQRAELGSGAVVGELSISAYRMDMRDEIDFDVSTFQYSNIGRSRHEGIEAGLKLWLGGATRASIAYTRQSVTARSGDHAGNALKAVPRDYFSLALRSAIGGAGEAGVTLTSAQRMFLDDANTRTIPNYTTVGVEGSYRIGSARIFGEVENLFDQRYNSTAFPDPAGSNTVFVNPAAGRSLRVGLSLVPGEIP